MSTTQKTYLNIDSKRMNAIRSAARGYGIVIDQNTGEGESFGVRLRWAWFPVSRQLAICIKESGLLTPQDALEFVDGIIRKAV